MSEHALLGDNVTALSETFDLYAGQSQPDSYTTLIEDGYQYDDTNPATVTITCLSQELKQSLLPEKKNVVVYADVLTIKSAIALPGRDLTIYARQLVSDGGSIDLTAASRPAGSPGNYSPGARARDGEAGPNRGDEGKRGTDGAHGEKGGTGGSLKIYAEVLYGALKVTSNGAPGGRGQDAGNGGDGQQGKDGRDAEIEGGQQQYVRQEPTRGEDGARGGDGATGGNGGEGGNAGQFQCTIARQLGTIEVRLSGGQGGQPGAPGSGGKAGNGGNGGRYAECKNTGRGVDTMRQCSHIGRRAEPGGQGRPGSWGTWGRNGNWGYGSVQMTITQPTVGERFRKEVPQTYNAMVLRQAEMSYMNGDYLVASNLLQWVRLLKGTGAQRSETLLTQLNQGLNYYGRPANHVPLVALDYYQGQLTALLLLGQNIENARNTYNNKQATQDAIFKALDSAIAESKTLQERLKDSLRQLGAQETQLQEEILQLVTARSRQRDVMLAAAATFKQAVEKKALGCSFEDLLKLTMTLVSVGKAVYGDITAIGGALGGLKSMTATLDGLQGAIKNITVAYTNVADLAKQWETVKTTLSPTAPDVSKMVAEQKDFDDMIKPYLEMPEAADYKKHVHDYIGIVQAVNKKLFDYNSVAVSRFDLTAQIAMKETEGAEIASRRAKATDPTLQHFRTFMAVAYEDVRKHIMRHLYEEICAYRYWRLAEKAFVVQDRTIGGLTTIHAGLKSEILDVLNERITPMQSFENKVVTLAEATRREQFESFRAGYLNERNERMHELTFTIPFNGDSFPLGWSHLLATNFAISIPGARTTDGTIDVRLMHSGQVVLRDQKGGTMEFNHVRRLADYSYEIATGRRLGGGNLGGDGDNKQYIGLSPYSTWTIRIKADHNPGLNLSDVREIKLTFAGKYYPTLNAAGKPVLEASESAEAVEEV